jgi:hypothetical protein
VAWPKRSPRNPANRWTVMPIVVLAALDPITGSRCFLCVGHRSSQSGGSLGRGPSAGGLHRVNTPVRTCSYLAPGAGLVGVTSRKRAAPDRARAFVSEASLPLLSTHRLRLRGTPWPASALDSQTLLSHPCHQRSLEGLQGGIESSHKRLAHVILSDPDPSVFLHPLGDGRAG